MTLSMSDLGNLEAYTSKGYALETFPDGEVLRWTAEADKQLDPGYDWEGIFERKPELVRYRSTSQFIGENEEQRGYDFLYKDTGYIRPFFNDQLIAGNEYNNTLRVLGLKTNNSVALEKLIQIDQYQQLLQRQLQRQLEYLQQINGNMVDVLKVLLFEAQKSTKHTVKNDESKEGGKKTGNVWEEFVSMLRSFYKNEINRFEDLEIINARLTSIMALCKEIDSNLYSAIHTGILILAKQREPVIAITSSLIGRINSVESLLEDIHLNQKVKPSGVFNKLYKPHEDVIYEAFQRLKYKDYSVKQAFFKIKERLQTRGWDPVDYYLKDDPEHFNKNANNWKTRQHRK